MIGSGDFAKILYWLCVIWPLASIIGILACRYRQAKIQCHFIVSFILIILTIASFLITDDFYLSIIWNHDGLTRFFRVMIAMGAGLVTVYLNFWCPDHLHFSKDKHKLSVHLTLFHLLIATSILSVGINNFFVALVFLAWLIFLLIVACFVVGGSEAIQTGWDYFRYLLMFMAIALVGVFVLGLPLSQTHPLLYSFGSFIIAFGIVVAIGLFPVFISFLRLITILPILIGSIVLFILPLSFLTLFIRLYQIGNYQNPQGFLLGLVFLSLIILLLKEKDDPLQVITPLLVTLTVLAGIFADHVEGVYSVCLMVMMLVFFAPLSYIIQQSSYRESLTDWLIIAVSGFPPFGIFLACSSLVSYLLSTIPLLGWGLLGFFLIRGRVLFKMIKAPLFSKQILMHKGYYLIAIIIAPTLLIPLFANHWLYEIARQFVQNE